MSSTHNFKRVYHVYRNLTDRNCANYSGGLTYYTGSYGSIDQIALRCLRAAFLFVLSSDRVARQREMRVDRVKTKPHALPFYCVRLEIYRRDE